MRFLLSVLGFHLNEGRGANISIRVAFEVFGVRRCSITRRSGITQQSSPEPSRIKSRYWTGSPSLQSSRATRGATGRYAASPVPAIAPPQMTDHRERCPTGSARSHP